MSRFQKDNQEGPAESSRDRLDSWKEIAAYLRRDVSTLHRWERREGLPVHRHLHNRAASVYAYRSELDAWWNNCHGTLKQGTTGRSVWRKLTWVAVLLAALVVAAAVGWWWQRAGTAQSLPFHDRDWVLINTFDNRTDDPLLDGTLEYALERELSNSHYVNVVPRPRIDDALRLMKMPAGALLDPAVAREVCLRDGGIHAMVTGRIEKLDSTYLLNLRLVNPADGATVAAHSEEVEGHSEILPAVRRLSSWVRETLGETLSSVRETEEKLAKVTTPSLRALQLFTRADALERAAIEDGVINRDKHAVVAELLKAALVEDPEFAAACTWLAWALRNQGETPKIYMDYARKGFDLSDRVSDRERYITQGSYYLLAEEWENALPLWEALLRSYPEDYWGNNNIRGVYWAAERFESFAEQEMRMARLRPNDFSAVARAARVSVETFGDLERARPLVLKALELASSGANILPEQSLGRLHLFPAFEKWIENDLEQAVYLGESVRDFVGSLNGTLKDAIDIQLSHYYFALGKLETARGVYPDRRVGQWECALAAYLSRADQKVPGLEALTCEGSIWPFGAYALARAGRLALAESLLSEDPANLQTPYRYLLKGELARVRGENDEAEAAFKKGLELCQRWQIPRSFFLASESLAQIYEQRSEPPEAVKVLEAASLTRKRCSFVSAGFWVRNQWLLAELYRRLGEEQNAVEIEDELRVLLEYADPDHPILLGLNSLAVASDAGG